MWDVGQSVRLASNKNARTFDDDGKSPVPHTIEGTVLEGYAVFLPEGLRVYSGVQNIQQLV